MHFLVLNGSEHKCAKKFTSKALNVRARARAIKEHIFEHLFAKFGRSQNKTIMRYTKLKQNWEKEFISEVKLDIGAF